MRNPVVLARDHPLAILLLRHLHRKRGHCGYKSPMHEARRMLWITGPRKMAKSVVSKCVDCRKLRKKPLQQLKGDLPSLRVAAGFPPFSEHRYGHVRAAADQTEPKNTPRSPGSNFYMRDKNASGSPGTRNRQVNQSLPNGPFNCRFACLRGHPNVC